MDTGSEKSNLQKPVIFSPHQHIHTTMGFTPDHMLLPAQSQKQATGLHLF
jgi:hypothetical protein